MTHAGGALSSARVGIASCGEEVILLVWWRRVLDVCAVGVLLCACWGVLVVESALALPEGRHYEMVSPPYKGGYGVLFLQAVAMAGDREGDGVVFASNGSFAGQPIGALTGSYVARRGTLGWSTIPALLPPAVTPEPVLNDVSPVLLGLYYGAPGLNATQAPDEDSGQFFYHDLYAPDDTAGILTPFAEPFFGVPLVRLDEAEAKAPFRLLGSIGSDPRFCHVLFGGTEDGALLPEALGAASQLYELVTGAPGCGEQRALRLVSVSNAVDAAYGEPKLLDRSCRPVHFASKSLNVVAAEGSEIFFATELQPGCEMVGNPALLFVRLNGERTVEVSARLKADCKTGPCTTSEPERAEFAGAGEGGTRVFFTTTQSLVTGDVDYKGNDLYMAKIGCPEGEPECPPAKREVLSLVQVSHDENNGEAAEVLGVSVVSKDGRRAYFVARGVLSGSNGEGRAPVSGADNLYVWDNASGHVKFVADLCSGPGVSGGAADAQCPSDLTNSGALVVRNDEELWHPTPKLQTTDSGSFLVFEGYGRLTTNDVDDARDLYRYDAERETLVRVSAGQEGFAGNGNVDDYDSSGRAVKADARLPLLAQSNVLQSDELNYRAMSEDGSRIVFESVAPLSPAASNGLLNAYEWHEGTVSLVSSGDDEEPVGMLGTEIEGVAITPSGNDLFFVTVKGLVPQDVDGARDVYDARLGPGFQSQPEGPAQCEPGACHGPLTSPAPVLVPGSISQAPGENYSIEGKMHKRQGRHRCVQRKSARRAAARRGHARTCVRGARRGSHRDHAKQQVRTFGRQGGHEHA